MYLFVCVSVSMVATLLCVIAFYYFILCRYDSLFVVGFFFFQAEDGIRYLVRSRGLGDVYKRQV